MSCAGIQIMHTKKALLAAQVGKNLTAAATGVVTAAGGLRVNQQQDIFAEEDKQMNRENRLSDARFRLGIYAMLIALTAVLALAFVLNGDDTARASEEPALPTTNLPALMAANAQATNSYAAIVSRISPAVVTIRSEARARAPQQHPFLNDPRFREFFGDRMPQMPQQRGGERRRSGLGSGVIVTADGYILTNHHVIDGAERISVQLTDNRTFDAKVVGSDPPSDLAVLKVEAASLPVLNLGNSDDARVGDVVLAVGNPLGVGQTVTSGIVSAKGRSTGLSDGSFEDFIQTDAPINQGNSGGALVSMNGELIGINSQILSPSGGNIGIGFAIPSNMAKGVMDQLMKTGKVRRGVLGVVVQPLTSDIAQSLALKDANGVIINSVQAGSAAERAGLKQGDVITKFNGAAVVDSNSFRNHIAGTQPGTNVTFTALRDGREQQLSATLGERAAEGEQGDARGNSQDGVSGGKLGISVEPLTPELAAQLNLPQDAQGLVVRGIDGNGPAAAAGLQQGDVIVTVNRQPVRSVEQLRSAIEGSIDRQALLLINRRGNNIYLTVRPRQ